MEEPPPAPRAEPLPIELQLEIAAHSGDAKTFIRCAAASKALQAAMHGPAFRHRRRAALSAAVHAGVDPAELLGVSGASIKPAGIFSTSVVFEDQTAGRPRFEDQTAGRPRIDTNLLRSFEPVSSRDGLLVLWRRRPEPELRVFNTSTGRVVASLPPLDVEEGKWGSGGIYRPALLSVSSRAWRLTFELLVMDVCFRIRVFSSMGGRWGAIRVVKPPPPPHDSWSATEQAMRTSPAVVGGTAHWICRSTRSAGLFILAVHAGAPQATAIAPPPQGRPGAITSYSLTETAESLGMVVSEADVISMWKLSAERWSKQVVISRQVTPGMDDVDWTACWCVGFRGGFRGDLLLWMERIGLVKLNLGTKETTVLRSGNEHDDRSAVTPVRLHEIDLAFLL